MDLKDLLRLQGFDPDAREQILLVRHCPFEASLARAMPWIISERRDLFETYQTVPGNRVAGMQRAKYVVTCLGLTPGRAHFVGLYKINRHRMLDMKNFWAISENRELAELGYEGLTDEEVAKHGLVRQYDLEPVDFYPEWSGRLIIGYPPPERSWFRWVDRGQFPVISINEDSAFVQAPPEWRDIDLTYAQLSVLPRSWQARLSEWRGIYLVFDEGDGKSYVGSAYGGQNILGRWQAYAADGHGGNRDLKGRDPSYFRFSILDFGFWILDFGTSFARSACRGSHRTGKHMEGEASHKSALWAERQLIAHIRGRRPCTCGRSRSVCTFRWLTARKIADPQVHAPEQRRCDLLRVESAFFSWLCRGLALPSSAL